MTVCIAFLPSESGLYESTRTPPERRVRPQRYTVSRVNEELLERYAELIVGFGANVQPNQVVAVEGPPEAAPLVRRIARAAVGR